MIIMMLGTDWFPGRVLLDRQPGHGNRSGPDLGFLSVVDVFFFEWLWSGQTPGKRLRGIRVIQRRGTALTFYDSALRT